MYSTTITGDDLGMVVYPEPDALPDMRQTLTDWLTQMAVDAAANDAVSAKLFPDGKTYDVGPQVAFDPIPEAAAAEVAAMLPELLERAMLRRLPFRWEGELG